MRRVITLLLTIAMALSLVVVANATSTVKQSVYLKTEKVENNDNTVTYTFTLDASKCDGVGALEFYVAPTNLTFQSKVYPEAAKLKSVFEVTDFNGGSGHAEFIEDENYFIAYGGNTKVSPARVLTGSVALVSVTYKIDASNYDLKVTGFKACYNGDQAALESSRYNCVIGDGVLKGDVNGDGKIKMNDVMAIYNYLMGNVEFSNDQFMAADVTNDGKIKMNDVMKVYNYVMGDIDSLD